MNKENYMRELEKCLSEFDRELQQEIIEDYEGHFAEGARLGKSEEEIVAELGNIQDMVEELREFQKPKENMELDNTRKEETQDLKKVEAGKKSGIDEGEVTCDCRKIKVSCQVADIVAGQSRDELIHVRYVNGGSNSQQMSNQFYWEEKDGIFYTGVTRRNFSRMGFFGGFFHSELILYVDLPKGMQEVTFQCDSGDIDAKQIQAEVLCVKSVSGDISLFDIQGKQIAVDSVSGDVGLHQIEAERLSAKTTSGDLAIQEVRGKEILVNSVSGDVEGSRLAGDYLKAGTVSGDTSIEGEFMEYKFQTTSGDLGATIRGVSKVQAGSGSGDIAIRICGADGFTAQVATGSGDVDLSMGNTSFRDVKNGTYTLGGAACTLQVKSGSGDIQITA